ncbi:hypothetical protein EW146_g2584 [Bondarzewia mesenterica]|uniref:Fatty acid desaturase domain-containing protein n=1 Tax=Bondarzewia mesenterica TaxID=1095465 RepID=A0A4S4M058_9AGAM|nr:hypothetical protein EW146_g2584 [Bondarzewia mesenterica]
MGKPNFDQCTQTRKQTYSEVDTPTFTPLSWSMKEIRKVIPPHLFVRHASKGLSFLARDIYLAFIFFVSTYQLSYHLDTIALSNSSVFIVKPLARIGLWCTYWVLQGFVLTGVWVIGHECGHGAFSAHTWLCDTFGFLLHTLLLTPYFSWKISHHRHHMNHASMENDEPYIPKTRSELAIPVDDEHGMDYEEYFSDTPMYTLFMLVRQQLFAFPAYLLFNVSSQRRYPKLTNHFNRKNDDPRSLGGTADLQWQLSANCVLFTREQRSAVLISDLGISVMVYALKQACEAWGIHAAIKYYGIPWLFVNHWFVMITYLQHTGPMLPHYRNGQWNFQRGAAATMDREFLGFIGRCRSITEPVFKALWSIYNTCQFVEDEGDVVFYQDKQGRASCRAL